MLRSQTSIRWQKQLANSKSSRAVHEETMWELISIPKKDTPVTGTEVITNSRSLIKVSERTHIYANMQMHISFHVPYSYQPTPTLWLKGRDKLLHYHDANRAAKTETSTAEQTQSWWMTSNSTHHHWKRKASRNVLYERQVMYCNRRKPTPEYLYILKYEKINFRVNQKRRPWAESWPCSWSWGRC